MKYQKYEQIINRAVQLFERGDYQKAIVVFKEIVSSDIADVDKAMMCLNLGIAYDRLDQTEEALVWYEKGVAYEKSHGQYFVAQKLAAYLTEKGRYSESLVHFKALLDNPDFTESDADRTALCFNLAVICDRMGQTEEAVAWYEKGAGYENPHGRYFAAEKLAAYLAEKGRYSESLAHYNALLHNPSLTEPEKHRIEQTVKTLQKRA